jgi:phosphatidylglycerol:prolipoprotein diacylglycerol transferase
MGSVAGLFLVGYGISRFIVEFVRVPDKHLGFVAFDWMSQGQLLSIPMILLGVGFIVWAYKRNPVPAGA